MTFSDWNLVGCRTPHDAVQLSSQRLLPQGPLFSKTSARADSQKRRSPVPFRAILSDHSNQDENSPRLEKFRFQQTARDASGATQISQRAWLELCSHQPMMKSDWVSHGLGQSRSGASRQQVKPGAQRPESGNSRAQRLREALDSQQGFE